MLQAFVLVLVLTSSPHADFQRAVGDEWWCSVLESRKKICSSDSNLQSKMLFFSSSALCFVYFHMVRTALIYSLHFLLSLLTMGLSHLLLRQAWEGRT